MSGAAVAQAPVFGVRRVLVVGAGPAGSTAATYLARAGFEVVVVEKTFLPRPKVCGDGLTPRAVHELQLLGVPHKGPQWRRVRGLRLVAGGKRLEVPWPTDSGYPEYGLVRTREGFDAELVACARAAGAQVLEGRSAVEALVDRSGRVRGARVASVDERGRKTGAREDVAADVVLAADGASSRVALSVGLGVRPDRPLGVAARTYFASPRHEEQWLEGWLELPGEGGPLPGYGWVFGVGDGTCNVGVGLLNTSSTRVDCRRLLERWVAGLPPEWSFDAEHQRGPVGSACLPMAFNRAPHYYPGLVLLGDAAGLVSPFNGEGICYAMASARLAAGALVSARRCASVSAFDARMADYGRRVCSAWGRHFTLGRAGAALIGHPTVLQAGLRVGMSVPALMRVTVAVMANMVGSGQRRPVDAVLRVLEGLVPATDNTGGRVSRDGHGRVVT